MKPEDRLRDAIHDYTDAVEPADAWGRIRERTSARRRPWWKFAVAGAAVVALTLGAVVLVRAGDESDGPQIATPPGGVDDLSQVAAITADGRLVLLDARTGDEILTLADDASPTGGLAATPDGSHLFYTRDTGDECRGIPFKVLVRLEVATRATEVVSSGVRYPAVSPDGRSLAFTGIPNCSDGGNRILVIDLADDPSDGTSGRDYGGESWPLDLGISLLSWAPDSRHLLFTPWDDPAGSFPRILDTSGTTSLEEAPRVLNPDGSRITGYFDADQFIGTRCPGGDQLQPLDVVAFDATGAIGQTLFQVPEQCGADLAVLPGADADSFLVVRYAPMSTPAPLYRWNTGASQPTRLADGIAAAVWVPESHREPPGSDLAVAFQGGRIALVSSDGEERTLVDETSTSPSLPGATAVAMNDEYVYFSRQRERGPDCVTSDVLRVPRSGGEVEVIAEGWAPTVSPSRTRLAYVAPEGASCEPATLVVRDLVSGVERRLTSSDQVGVGAPTWSADSERLAVTIPGRYLPLNVLIVDVEASDSLDAAQHVVIEDTGCNCDPVAFFGDGTSLVVPILRDRDEDRRPRREEIVVVDIATSEIERTLFSFELSGAHWRIADLDVVGDSVFYTAIGDPSPGAETGVFRWTEEGGLERVTSRLAWAIAPDRVN